MLTSITIKAIDNTFEFETDCLTIPLVVVAEHIPPYDFRCAEDVVICDIKSSCHGKAVPRDLAKAIIQEFEEELKEAAIEWLEEEREEVLLRGVA